MAKINYTKHRVKINYEIQLKIEKLLKEKNSVRDIAKETGIPRSTIHNEIVRNRYTDSKVYTAERAHWLNQERAKKKNWKISKIHNKELIEKVGRLLKQKKSPKHIAMYLKKKYSNNKNMHISHETIYKIIFSYKHIKWHYLSNWYTYLKKKHKKRHIRGHTSPTRVKKAYYTNSIHDIPKEFRKQYGVWEVDTMYIKNGFILVAVEVLSKKVLAKLLPDLKSNTMTKAMQFLFSRVEVLRAIICDRGSENTGYTDWESFLGVKVYACDAGRPGQKGLLENSIRQFRYDFSRKTDYNKLTDKDVYKVSAKLNNMYRISLDKKTANQVYHQKNCTK